MGISSSKCVAPDPVCSSQPNRGVCNGKTMHRCNSAGRTESKEECETEALCRAGISERKCVTPPEVVPLQSFWQAMREDNFTTATPEGVASARSAGYSSIRVEGYVFAEQQPGTVPLKLYWHEMRGDNYTTGTAEGEASAQAAGYQYVRIEGYAYSTPQQGTRPLQLFWSASREDNFSTATDAGANDARAAAYQLVRTEAYVLNSPSP